MTGVVIPHGLARMGQRRNWPITFCRSVNQDGDTCWFIPPVAYRQQLECCENMHGASEDHVPECFVEPEHHHRHSKRASRPAHPLNYCVEWAEAPGSLHMQQPVSSLPYLGWPLWSATVGDSKQSLSSCSASVPVQIRCWCLIGPASSCTGCRKNDRCFAPTRTRSQWLMEHGSLTCTSYPDIGSSSPSTSHTPGPSTGLREAKLTTLTCVRPRVIVLPRLALTPCKHQALLCLQGPEAAANGRLGNT